VGILVECPKCKVRGSVKRKVCKCGNQVQKSNVIPILKINPPNKIHISLVNTN